VDDLVVSTSKLGEARRGILADACLNTGVRLLNFGLHWEEMNGDGADPHADGEGLSLATVLPLGDSSLGNT